MDSIIRQIVMGVPMPKMAKVRQHFDTRKIEDIPKEIAKVLSRDVIKETVKPGMRICITCGSRGIANSALIAKELVSFVKSRGAEPFIIPAMGSHGGATAEGQLAVLRDYGITEEYCQCPIISSMETVKIGVNADRQDVFIDKAASEADGIILNNRIKPHTSFRGPYESGLMKMAAIGLGKQHGAEACHMNGYDNMGYLVPLFGKTVLANAKILFGLGYLENAYDQTCKMVALTPDEIIEEEPKLLKEAFSNMARILIDETDVLIVDWMGKEISGAGMDPNVIGRFFGKGLSGGIKNSALAVLDLTDFSHGNAIGVGFADFTTRRLFNKIDFEHTYPNGITCFRPKSCNIPPVMENDALAIAASIFICVGIDRNRPRVVRIKNTLDLKEIEVSEALKDVVLANPNLELLSEFKPLEFNKDGNLW